jgi:surface antigen/uncharacterized coiled-coil protein SlyX
MAKGGAKKIIVETLAILMVVAMSFSFSSADTLSDLQKQKNQKMQDLQNAQAAAANKAQQAKALSAQINNLDNDIKNTEGKIASTSQQIDEVSKQIDQTTQDINQKNDELAKLKKKLNSSLVEIYRFSARSDWELLFGSDTIGGSSNQEKYVEAIETQVKSLYNQVRLVKEDLEKDKADQESKKAELDSLKAQQEAYKKGAEYQKTQKDQLLGMTIQQQQSYEEQAQKISQEVAQLSNEIYKKRQEALGGGENLGGGSGYSYSCGNVDPWGFYTCQCTSYAAWYWNVMLGRKWERGDGPTGTGDARNWPNLAARNGVGVHSSPQVGAIISWPGDDVYIPSSYGHVAIVEGINSDGTITISEYNWISLSFSRRKINPAKYGSYSYIY